MDKLQQAMKNTRGFSLIEVVVALVIFSLSVITIFQLITSTSVSIFSLEDRLLAKEVANNRMALINTLEKPINISLADKIPAIFNITIAVKKATGGRIHSL